MTRMKTHLGRIFGWMRLHTVALGVLLLLAAILTPVQVQGQFSPCCAILSAGLGTINATLGRVIGGGLSAINAAFSSTPPFQDQHVCPVSAISQTRAPGG